MASNSAISIDNLTKVFRPGLTSPPVVAVRNLSLSVDPGMVYGLLGPNGSGKSTTFKILLGLIPPTEGSTSIFGIDSKHVASRRSVGFLPENPYFYKYLTGKETLHFFGKICGLTGKYLNTKVPELLNLVGLEHAANRRLAGYSKGMLQRIGLAQALVQNPRLVVLDEPTAGVDPAGSREIRDLIMQLKARGITVLLCSHLLAQVQEVCDRIGIMHRGVLVKEGPLNELISIKTQRELIVENVPAEALARMQAIARESGGKVVSLQEPQTTLEALFLDVTSAPSNEYASGSGRPQL